MKSYWTCGSNYTIFGGMFGIGFSEFLFIGILALIVIGPKQLPEVARTLARFLNELRRAGASLRSEFTKESSNFSGTFSKLFDEPFSDSAPQKPKLSLPTLPLKPELPQWNKNRPAFIEEATPSTSEASSQNLDAHDIPNRDTSTSDRTNIDNTTSRDKAAISKDHTTNREENNSSLLPPPLTEPLVDSMATSSTIFHDAKDLPLRGEDQRTTSTDLQHKKESPPYV